MNKRKIFIFLLLTFFLSWILALLFYLSGENWNISPLSQITGIIYMFMPLLSAIIVQRFIYKGEVKESLGISFKFNKWFLIAYLLPFFISICVSLFSIMMPDVSLSLDLSGFYERYRNIFSEEQIQTMKLQFEKYRYFILIMVLIQSLIAGLTINALFAFGEETGWRGFLFNELKNLRFWESSFLIGFIWGLWHAPIIAMGHNYPQHPKIGILMMILFCILYSPIFNYIRIKTKSVIGPSLLHGSLNATAGFTIMFLKGGNDLTIGITGIAGFISLIIIDLFLLLDKEIKNKKIKEILGG
uniref:CPBP family intramembrane metalloprotease n=1 Tax=candidate division WOR-3 bacterium TaxID=2052148 RepID=A0A7C4UHP0_UNCW3